MRRLLGMGSIYTLGGLTQTVASAVSIPAITRLLGAEDYGEVTVVIAIVVVLGPVASLGVPAAIIRLFYGAEDLDGRGPILARQLVATCAAIAALVVLLTAASTLLWGPLLAPVSQAALLLGAATALPLAVMGATRTILQAEERPVAYIVVTLLGTAGAQILGIGALVLVDNTPTLYLLGFGGGISVAAVVGAFLSRATTAGLADRRTLRAALEYGLPTVPHLVAVFVLALGDRVLIQVIDGTAAVGRYQVAYALGALSIAGLFALQTAWVPITFGSEADRRWPDLAASAVVITRLGALLVVVLVLLSPIGLPLLAPSEFEPGELQVVCAIVALGALPLSIYLPLIQVLFWERKTKPLLWVTPAAAVVNLVLTALLLGPFGLEGAAAATALALTLQAVLLERATRRIADVPWRWPAMLGNVGAGMLMVMAVFALPGGAAGVVLRTLLLIAVMAAAAVTVVRAVRTPASAAVPGTG